MIPKLEDYVQDVKYLADVIVRGVGCGELRKCQHYGR